MLLARCLRLPLSFAVRPDGVGAQPCAGWPASSVAAARRRRADARRLSRWSGPRRLHPHLARGAPTDLGPMVVLLAVAFHLVLTLPLLFCATSIASACTDARTTYGRTRATRATSRTRWTLTWPGCAHAVGLQAAVHGMSVITTAWRSAGVVRGFRPGRDLEPRDAVRRVASREEGPSRPPCSRSPIDQTRSSCTGSAAAAATYSPFFVACAVSCVFAVTWQRRFGQVRHVVGK